MTDIFVLLMIIILKQYKKSLKSFMTKDIFTREHIKENTAHLVNRFGLKASLSTENALNAEEK